MTFSNTISRAVGVSTSTPKWVNSQLHVEASRPVPTRSPDPHTTLPEATKLPSDRREWNVSWYRYLRTKWVEELQADVAAQKAKITETKDRWEKSALGIHLHSSERRLAVLLAIPRLNAKQMCADCYTPAFQHASGGDIYDVPPVSALADARRADGARIGDSPRREHARSQHPARAAQASAVGSVARRPPDHRSDRAAAGAAGSASRCGRQARTREPLGTMAP